ncbi:GNAT family N-acetyltransferase [Dactylosporangium sp. CA-139066]|uniref:GNAT family N-acetyltransferase n=1 Tax=Dactylosporangium sp. CA-139066 TaxID=3239930 RepID=UPI003D921DDE
MGASLVYRGGIHDLEGLLPLVREFCAADRHEFDADRVTRALRPLLASDEHGQVWLLGSGEGAAPGGYAVLTWGWSLESGGREALLDEIYVRERGGGHGAALLGRVLEAAAAAGAAAMFLETEAHNERVRGFYARHGFAAEASIWMSRPLGGDRTAG